MNKKNSDSNLVVDVKIHYQGKVYALNFSRVLRWLIPIVLVIYRLVTHGKEAAP